MNQDSQNKLFTVDTSEYMNHRLTESMGFAFTTVV